MPTNPIARTVARAGGPGTAGRALDEPARRGALGAWLSAVLGALAGALVLDVADREPQQLDRGGVVGEVAAFLMILRSS